MHKLDPWKEIWENRVTPELQDNTVYSQIELINLNGFDHPGIFEFDQWNQWFLDLRKKEYQGINSIYEIGCGSGGFLNYFSDLKKLGGCDYSESLLEVAKKQFPNGVFSNRPGSEINTLFQYDNVSSFSVFQYMTKAQAWDTLENMRRKSGKSFFIFDVPLKDLKKECEKFRQKKEMKKSHHTYYKMKFFLNFAREYGLAVKFQMQNIPSYMHNDYRFNVYFYHENI